MIIAYISDGPYVRATAISIRSLLASNPLAQIYVIAADLSSNQCSWLRSLGEAVEVLPIPRTVQLWLDKFATHGADHVTESTYLKAQLHNLLPAHERVLYLDGDVIVAQDLTPLYKLNLQSCMVGATFNYTVRASGRRRLRLQGNYFNAGVLLCPLNRWREDAVEQTFLDWYSANKDIVKYDDQDIFNAIFDGNVAWIDKKWNVSQTEIFSAFHSLNMSLGDCGIVHFNGPKKPWDVGFRERYGLTDLHYENAMRLVAPFLRPDEAV